MARVARVILFAKDFDKMVQFYRDVIGLTPQGKAEPGWQEFDAGGCSFALHGLPDHVTDDIVIEDPPRARSSSWTKVVFHADDPAALREELLTAGLPMGELHHFDDMTFVDTTDPEGNVIQFSNR